MEVLALTWGDVDFSEGVIRARFQLSRQGKRVALKTKAAKRDIVLMGALGKLLLVAASPRGTRRTRTSSSRAPRRAGR
jgi:hypothetical protein